MPKKVDILITHCPPYKILDQNRKGVRAGSRYLREISLDRKPFVHVFGHIHESSGEQLFNDTRYINAALRPRKFIIGLK